MKIRLRDNQDSSFGRKFWVYLVAFFFFVLLIASFFGERGWVAIYRTQQKKEALLNRIDELTAMKKILEREIEELNNNPEAVELTARKKLWLIKPGEVVIIKDNK